MEKTPATWIKRNWLAIFKSLVGLIVFVSCQTIITLYLQSSLVIVRHVNDYAHWAAILLVVPLVIGFALRISRVPYPGFVVVIGGIISAAIVYPYYHLLWAQPPHILAAFLFAFVTAGVAYSIYLPSHVKLLWLELRKHEVPGGNGEDQHGSSARPSMIDSEDELKDDQGCMNRCISAMLSSSLIEEFEPAKLAVLLSALQLLISVISFLSGLILTLTLGN